MPVVDADFAAFVRSNGRALLRVAWLLTADHHAAEDLVQTALEKTLPRWASIREDDPVAYVNRVKVNTRTSWWRRHRNRETLTNDSIELVEATDRSERFADRSRLAVALRALPDGQRKVAVLRHYADMSEAQVADLLGCSIGTVKSQNARALGSAARCPASGRAGRRRATGRHA